MKYLLLLICLLLIIPVVDAHPGHDDESVDTSKSYQAPSIDREAAIAYAESHNTGKLSDFFTLHPLVVHFPIVFLVLAFFVQLFSFFIYRKELSWAAFILVFLGFIGAVVATRFFHGGDPIFDHLSETARKTFETHEKFAHLTILFSGIGAAVKAASLLFLKQKLWIELIAGALLFGALYCIHTTGNMGARLVHIETIGVQQNQIPPEDM